MKALKLLNPYLLRYKWRLLFGFFIIIAARVFAVVSVDFVGDIIQSVNTYLQSDQKDYAALSSDLFINLLYIIAAALISGFFTFLMRQMIIVVSRFIEADLKDDIYAQYQRLSLSFYKNNRTGDLMNRISEDVSKVRMYLGPAIMYCLTALVLFATVIPVMYNQAPSLTLYVLIPLPVLSIAIYNLSKAIHKRSTVVQEYLSKLTTFTQESFSGISVIKAYNLEFQTHQDFTTLSDDSKTKNLNLVKVQAFFFPLMIALIGASNLLVIYFGGKQLIEGQIESIETVVEFIIYVNMLTWPVATIGLTAIAGDIVFDNVSFTYPDTGITALQEISFTVNQGETLAIIGKTGSGKSTILELIGRLYDINKGAIIIDEHKIDEIKLETLRSNIGYVPQDAFLFSDTIRENIKFGDQKADDDRVVAFAKAAVVHNNIIEFKEGYDTVLGERGITLSGGQKQRVSIARALIADPKILLLDDCLSAVDTETEEEILSNLGQITKKTTTIIVSHRISSAKSANKILVLDQGSIIQQGTHNQLINIEGYYRELYLEQLP